MPPFARSSCLSFFPRPLAPGPSVLRSYVSPSILQYGLGPLKKLPGLRVSGVELADAPPAGDRAIQIASAVELEPLPLEGGDRLVDALRSPGSGLDAALRSERLGGAPAGDRPGAGKPVAQESPDQDSTLLVRKRLCEDDDSLLRFVESSPLHQLEREKSLTDEKDVLVIDPESLLGFDQNWCLLAQAKIVDRSRTLFVGAHRRDALDGWPGHDHPLDGRPLGNPMQTAS